MAEKLCTTDDELRGFADDLFNYVWQKHKFRCVCFEYMFAAKLSFQSEQTEAKNKRYFEEYIGNAVVCSQYLLRDFCYYFFTKIGKDLVKSREFFHTFVYSVIFQWIRHRNDVIHKVLDSAAIIAEAILFCDAKENVAWDIRDAIEMFKSLFKCHFETEFFENGGWDRLEFQTFSDYMYLMILVQTTTKCRKLPYEKFKYTCSMFSLLKSSLVFFPIHNSYTRISCISSLDRNVHHFSYSDSLHVKLKELSMDTYSVVDELLKKIELAVTTMKSENGESSSGDYVCRFVGKVNVKVAPIKKDSITEKVQKESSTAQVAKKPKRKKSKKSKAEN